MYTKSCLCCVRRCYATTLECILDVAVAADVVAALFEGYLCPENNLREKKLGFKNSHSLNALFDADATALTARVFACGCVSVRVRISMSCKKRERERMSNYASGTVANFFVSAATIQLTLMSLFPLKLNLNQF